MQTRIPSFSKSIDTRTTARGRVRSSPRRAGISWPCRRSAACTTAISGRPEPRRVPSSLAIRVAVCRAGVIAEVFPRGAALARVVFPRMSIGAVGENGAAVVSSAPMEFLTRTGRPLAEDWERLVTFYAFPKEHWMHLRTTNVVESPFAAVRLRTAAAKRFKTVENATAVIWKTLLVAEQSFRRLDAPELLPEVAESVAYINGERAKRGNEKAAA